MPDRLAERYQEAIQDPDLLSHRGEIALLDARMAELLENVATGESGPAWGQLRELVNEMREAVLAGNPQMMEKCLKDMDEIIEVGVSRRATWTEILDIVDRIKDVKQGEHKRLATMHQMISVEQAMGMVARVTKAVIDNVSDPDERLAIVSDLRELTLRRNSG
jgi:hypothetical protein